MRTRTSDIFESYIKLSNEKEGIVKSASEEKESKELKKYKDSVSARVGSDTMETIEALYGVKLETIKGMEYEQNIAEVAHPNAVVISPSYDKLNGLVENINERHNIIRNKIMSKAPSGTPLLLKDAHKDLMMSLIRIGNDMDNFEEDDLRILADDCIEGLKKKADWMDSLNDLGHKAVDFIGGNKADRFVNDIGGVGEGAAAGAITGALLTSWSGPGALIGAGAGGLLGGIVGYLFNTSPKLKNIRENAKDLQDQLGDLKRAVPEESVFFGQVEGMIASLVKSSDDYLSALNIVHFKETKGESASQAEMDEVKKDTTAFVSAIGTFDRVRNVFIAKTKEGAFVKAIRSIPLPGIANDVEDVGDAFNTLAVAIDNLKATMTGVVNKAVVDAKKTPTVPVNNEESIKDTSKEQPILDFKKMYESLGRKPSKEEVDYFQSLK